MRALLLVALVVAVPELWGVWSELLAPLVALPLWAFYGIAGLLLLALAAVAALLVLAERRP